MPGLQSIRALHAGKLGQGIVQLLGSRCFFFHGQALILLQAHELDQRARERFFGAIKCVRDVGTEVCDAQRMQAFQLGQRRFFRGRRRTGWICLSLRLRVILVTVE